MLPPPPHEYAPAFAAYVALAQSTPDPALALATQLTAATALLAPLEPLRLHRYAPGKWSIQEMLGHLIDAERIFAYRALRIARADPTPLAGFAEDDYVAASAVEACAWNALLAEFTHVRQSTILLLRHLPPDAWTRMGTCNHTPISVRALAYIIIGHGEHHLAILRERYLKSA